MKSNQKTYTIIADKAKMSHEEWLNIRKNSIGGSEIATAIGASRWASQFELWAQKTGRIERVKESTDAMYWGTVLEPIIRDEFAKRTGMTVKTTNYIFASRTHPFMTANLDGFVDLGNGECAVLELKTAGSYAENDWQDGLPIEYFLQVQHYMFVTGMQKAYVAALIGGNCFKHIEVQRDDAVIEVMVNLATEFWLNNVKADTPPPVTDKDNSVLSTIYPTSKPINITLPDAFNEVLTAYESAKVAMDEAKAKKEAAEASIKKYMKDNETANCGLWKISWKSSSRKSLSTEKIKALLTEEQLESCTTISDTRTLRISKAKAK